MRKKICILNAPEILDHLCRGYKLLLSTHQLNDCNRPARLLVLEIGCNFSVTYMDVTLYCSYFFLIFCFIYDALLLWNHIMGGCVTTNNLNNALDFF